MSDRSLMLIIAILSLLAVIFVLRVAIPFGLVGGDAVAYWLTREPGPLYDAGPAEKYSFLYSPAFAQIISPIVQLPWPVFFGLYLVSMIALATWLLWPLPLLWRLIGLLLCVPEFCLANIDLLLALMCVLSVRQPALWAIGILTKIVPGLLLGWHLMRQEWGRLAIAVFSTTAIALVSYVFAPDQWREWVTMLSANRSDSPTLVFRVACAIAIVAYAARTERPWLLPVALVISAPVYNTMTTCVVLTAIPRLWVGRAGLEPATQGL